MLTSDRVAHFLTDRGLGLRVTWYNLRIGNISRLRMNSTFLSRKFRNRGIKLLFVFVCILASFSFSNKPALAALDGTGSGLVGWWKLDEGSGSSVSDSSGNVVTGTLAGTSTWTGSGQMGGAVSLDGVGNFVTFGDLASAEGMASLTVSIWVKFAAADTTSSSVFTKARSGLVSRSWSIVRNGTENYVFEVGNGTTIVSAVTQAAYQDTNWHHVVGVYNGSDVHIYVDGVDADSTPPAQTGTVSDSAHHVCLGASAGGSNTCAISLMNGLLDDARIYNRSLSASEVSQLYINGVAGIDTVVAPSVSTVAASSINSASATINGTTTSNGGDALTTRGFNWGLTTSYTSTTTENGSFGTGPFNANLTSLSCNTTYHYRAFATNAAGTTYGNDGSFITSSCAATAPTVTTQAASSLTPVSAVFNGTIVDNGNATSTARGFIYGLTTSYGATTTSSGLFGTGAFNATVSSLSCNTAYHFKAFASNTAGTGYGTDQIATTTSCSPTITSFTLPSNAVSKTVTISSFTATDNLGVTGYLLTEVATTSYATTSDWTGSVPTSYTFRTAGHQTLYAWVRDADGNVSTSTSASVYITLPSYTLPVGIPDPGFGLTDTLPTRPSPWNSSQPGYYYIDRHGTCTDTSNTYGYPGNARCTIPSLITKGSYIELKGVYDYSSGGVNPIRTATDSTKPNGNTWIANVDGPAYVTSSDANSKFAGNKVVARGSYLYFDNVNVDSTTIQIGTSGALADYDVDHMVIRNSVFVGDGATAENGISVGGNSLSGVANVLVYNNTISNYGDMAVENDIDVRAVTVNPYVTNAWVLGNTIHTLGNTSVFAGGQFGDDPSLTRYVYIGGNHVHDGRVGGISVKNISDVIISQNYVHDLIDTDWSEGKCFGAQYSPQNLWIINNECHHARSGVKIGSTDAGTWNIYILNNLLYDLKWQYHCSYTGCRTGTYPDNGAYDEAALSLWGGTNLYVMNNTIYDSSSGIISPATNRNYFIENNIISNLSESGGHHVWLYNLSGTQYIRNNLLYQSDGSVKIGWGVSTDYSSVSSFQTATGKCQGCFSSDPLFVNTSSYANLSIQSGSPAKAAALPASSLTSDVYTTFSTNYGTSINKDVISTSRPQGGTWDMGAYEFIEATDTQAPVITLGAASTAATTATINWSTDESATSTLEYGLTTSYGSYATSSGTTNHSVALTGLTASTAYHYKVAAWDGFGNATSSADLTFTTTENAVVPEPTSSVVIQPAGSFGGGGVAYIPQQMGQVPQLPAIPPTTIQGGIMGSGLTIKNTASQGKRSSEIKIIQKLLNSDPSTQVARTGAGSPGKETNYFGPATRNAVQRFQLKWGIVKNLRDKGYGLVGPKTKAKMNELLKVRR